MDVNPTVKHIRDYLKADGPISDFTYRCFVGMIETGEADYSDFATAGGDELAAKVRALKKGSVYG